MPVCRAAALLALIVLAPWGCGDGEYRFDFDGDGWEDLDDFDPRDASIRPGAADPFGDGIDQDCDACPAGSPAGAGDGIDRDCDGFPANEGASMSLDPLALDSVLNDLVASWCVSFSAPYGPGQDQGTPGFPNPSCAIPASGAAAGDLVINEVMQNPNSSDADREWFELFNPTGSDIDLMGWQISDFGNNLHVVDSSVIVPAGGWAVLGEVLDTASNGGVTVDYACFNDLGLDNSSDELVITSPEGVWVDWISWDNGVTFPDPSGVSMNLDPVFANGSDNDVGANWCESTAASYGDGGAGTPGAVNTSCP